VVEAGQEEEEEEGGEEEGAGRMREEICSIVA
jgi:hypothetical protein